MRRSGAPSQHGQAKRPKFISPLHASASQTNFLSATSFSHKSNPPLMAHTAENQQKVTNLQSNMRLNLQSSCEGQTKVCGGENSLSERHIRKTGDMLALLSKTSSEKPSQGDLQPKARIPLSPHKAELNICDNSNLGDHDNRLCGPVSLQGDKSNGSSNYSNRDSRVCCRGIKSFEPVGVQGDSTYSNSTLSGSSPCEAGDSNTKYCPASDIKYFNVMWCKASKKKHKKWEGDAVMSTSGRSVTLYDTEGKVIGRGTGYKVTELQALAVDETLLVGGKEIQVMSLLTEKEFLSGKCFSSSCDTPKPATESSRTALSQGHFKPFVNPLQKGLHGTKQPTLMQEKVHCVPKFDCTAENALVMPRPTPEQQWQNTRNTGQMVVDVVVDPHLSNFLRQHQREGVVFLYMCTMGLREHDGFGAILADDMGLGKTLQCIALIWTLLKQGPYGGKPVVKKVLILTPGSLVKNWFLEFKKWLGTERLNVYAVSAEKRPEDFVKSNNHPVLMLSYEMFVRSYDALKQIPFDLIICDEGHRLKNSAIKTTSLLMTLPCRRRVVLTGTPVQNDLQEFFSIVEFCNPGILGSSSAFRKVFEEPIVASRQPHASKEEKELGTERARELTRLTQMFVLRRTQEVNNDFLPPKVELVLFCRASELQKALYQQLLRSQAVRRCLQSGGLTHQASGSTHLTIIGALKQLCNHPALIHAKAVQAQQSAQRDNLAEDSIYSGLLSSFPASYNPSSVDVSQSGKLYVLSSILFSIWKYSSTDKVVLVSNHTKTLDMLERFCGSQGYTFLRLDGKTPTSQRLDLVNKFNKFDTHRIFLLSSKAGGVGLNLIGASKLILYDIDWNPANDLQAMARVWRDGQRKRVCIYRLLTTGSIEEKVYQRQVSKQGLSGTIMDQTSSSAVQFSLEDLKDLFSFNEDIECETHSMLACPCGGHPDYTPDTSRPTSVERSCQLGGARANGTGSTTQVSKLTMAQLLSWKHTKAEFAIQQQAWYLENAGEYLSYVFWNETNTQ